MVEASPAYSGVDRAAMLLVLLGEDVAGKVLSHCSETEVQQVGAAIARLGSVDDAVGARVLAEYHQRVMHGAPEEGGPERAERILRRVMPESLVNRIVKRREALPTKRTDDTEGLGGPLGELSADALARLLEEESPQVVALLLSRLRPEQSAAVLSVMPAERMADVAARIGRLRAVDPRVVEQVTEVLGERLAQEDPVEEIDATEGVERLGEILNLIDRSAARGLIVALQKEDAELAEEVREKLFTFELLLKLDLRGLQEILKQVDQKQLAVALKGADDAITEHIYGAMSERAQKMMQEEMEYMGSVRVKEIDEAQRELMQIVARLEEEGTIEIHTDDREGI
ncbi:MAG: flagellar motor switch protein FliG [Acidobacteriota bacterium]